MESIYAAEILIDKIKKDYQNDISLVVLMGSYLYNDNHSRSNVDLFFVPKTDRGYNLQFTFIIDGIGFDYWAIPWDRLLRIADFQEQILSIITGGKLLFYASNDDLNCWLDLKSKALLQCKNNYFTQRAVDKIPQLYEHYFDLQNAKDIAGARVCSINILYTIAHTLALLNNKPIKKGRSKLKSELLSMELIPEDFEVLYDVAFSSCDKDEIINAYKKLVSNTHDLILSNAENRIEVFRENWNDLYEEIINLYNKIYYACEINDSIAALFASAELTEEIKQATKNTSVSMKSLPNLVGEFNPTNLSSFFELAKKHQLTLEHLLSENNISVRRFENFEKLSAYLELL